MKGKEIVRLGAEAACEKKASDIVSLDMRKLCSFTEHFLICTGDTGIQIRAIADAILEKLKKKKLMPWHVEGYEEARWVLIDYGDAVIHIFHPETRDFYQLEKLWGDAPSERLD